MVYRAWVAAAVVMWLGGGALAAPEAPTTVGYEGPDKVFVDLIRPEKGGPRIFVEATLPDGEAGLFLVDTGAAISALSKDTAARLGLAVDYDLGFVEGLGGRARLNQAVVPTLALGEAVLRDVEFAVDVRGIPTTVGAMPLDGILGNNVWSHFALELDYPADLLVLRRPGTLRMPRRAEPLFFDGSHIFAPIALTTRADPPHTDRVVVQVDTGASGLLIAGLHGRRFEQDYTEGLEPIFGIGASELMPASKFFQVTRRIPVGHLELGGRKITAVRDARWLNFEGRAAIGPDGLKGLAGHEILDGSVVLLDYQEGKILLRKSRRRPRAIDGHARFLAQDVARYGDDRTRSLYRARLHIYMGNADEATTLLSALFDDPPPEVSPDALAEARVLLAAVRRMKGDLEGAWQALASVAPGELVEEGEIVAAVNGLLLEGRVADAVALAEAAVTAKPDEIAAQIALSDARFGERRWDDADAALLEANRLAQNPDANLLRRARIALAQGDRYGAMASVRRLLGLYPHEGLFLWFYALLLEGEADGPTFRHDMESAMARLHPQDRPLDFLVAAHTTLGDADRALALMEEGIARDCSRAPTEPTQDNCRAWYQALAHHETLDALHRIEAALSETGDRSDFLDTKAMVHLSRGEFAEAHAAAVAAARLAPSDIYMLWQAERLGQLVPAPTEAAASDEAPRP